MEQQPTGTISSSATVIVGREEVEKCAICLEEKGSSNFGFTRCMHGFHPPCLQQWIQHQKQNNGPTRCPVCRTDLSQEITIEVHLEDEDSDYQEDDVTSRRRRVWVNLACAILTPIFVALGIMLPLSLLD